MPRPSAATGYDHINFFLEWPKGLPGPNFWNPPPGLLLDMPEKFKHHVDWVRRTGIRFWEKVESRNPDPILGDKGEVDDIHALSCAVDAQDKLEADIETLLVDASLSPEACQPLRAWLEKGQLALLRFMEAVTAAESGERSPLQAWVEGPDAMASSKLEAARKRFRGSMARIDCPTEWVCKTKVMVSIPWVLLDSEEKIRFPGEVAPTASWKIPKYFLQAATIGMREAAEELHIQGRALSENVRRWGPLELPVTPTGIECNPAWEIIRRALILTVRSLENLWAKSPAISDVWPAKKRWNLFSWLQVRRSNTHGVWIAFRKQRVPYNIRDSTVNVRMTDLFYVQR